VALIRMHSGCSTPSKLTSVQLTSRLRRCRLKECRLLHDRLTLLLIQTVYSQGDGLSPLPSEQSALKLAGGTPTTMQP
jgi:hypothetical protein